MNIHNPVAYDDSMRDGPHPEIFQHTVDEAAKLRAKPYQINVALVEAAKRPPKEPLPPRSQFGGFLVIKSGHWNVATRQYVDVADLSDGRRLSRLVSVGRYGNAEMCYWELDPTDETKTLGSLSGDMGELARLIESLGRAKANPKTGTGAVGKPPKEIEFAKFAREWPHVAAKLGIGETTARPQRAFELGEIYRTMLFDREIVGDTIDWSVYLDRHGNGDFGVHGRLADTPELNEEQRWSLAIQPTPIRNAGAARSGVGVVRSQYDCEGPTGKRFAVHVDSALLRGHGNITWAYVLTGPRCVF